MDISYLKNNYNFIIDTGIYYHSFNKDEYFTVHYMNHDLLTSKIKTLFKNIKNNSSFHDKIYSKFDKYDLGAFWHYTHDNSNNLIVRIIFDNAQILTDTSFNQIIEIIKPHNNISFKKYKKIKKNNKTLKKII